MHVNDIEIIKVEVTNDKKLLVTPVFDKEKSESLYQFIYRMATGAYWNNEKQSFSSPVPREWSYFQWFENIVYCAKSELGISLVITAKTDWINVPDEEKKKMEDHVIANT